MFTKWKDEFLKEGKTEEEKAKILTDTTYCLLSNKPSFNWGRSATAFADATSSILDNVEYDLIDMVQSMDPDSVTRFA